MRFSLTILIIGLLHLANAGAMTVSGDIVLLNTPPVSAATGDLVSRSTTHGWAEQQMVWPANPFSVDVIPFQNNANGIYKSGKKRVQSTWSGNLLAGNYDSFIVHADTPRNKRATFAGSITFDEAIAGISFRQLSLVRSDALFGAPGTIYANRRDDRSADLGGSKNWFSISPDGYTFSFQTVVRQDINEFRVFTYSPTQVIAPLPASIWLFGSALCLLTWARRRSSFSSTALHDHDLDHSSGIAT